jgi:hypothetical protein
MTTSPRKQAQQQQRDRLQRKAERQQQRINNPARPARQGPNGSVIPLGGDAANPIRTIGGTSGGTPVGSPVTLSSGGISGGMPRGVEVTSQQLRALEEKAARIDFTAGLQVIAANPNDLDGDGSDRQKLARRPGDCCLDTTTGTYYYWNTTEKLWITIATPRQKRGIGIAAPAVQQYPFMIGGDIATEDHPRLIEALRLTWRNQDGTTGTAGAAALLINGSAVTLGTTQMTAANDYLALNVTNAGTADFLLAEVFFTLV